MRITVTFVAGLCLLVSFNNVFAMGKRPPHRSVSTATKGGGLAVRPVGVTLRDRLYRAGNGDHFYFTAHDGVWRHLPKIAGARPALSGLRLSSTGATTVSPSRPTRVMLNELGLTTPVRDQGPVGSCTIFSALGTIESEYLAQYGLSLDLSEEYVISMMNEHRSPDWVGGMPAEKLYIASYYGVAPESDWPYILPGGGVFGNVEKAFGVNPGNSNAVSQLGQNVWNNELARDIANYNSLVYPPANVHPDAIYGPTPNSLAPVQMNGTDPTPFETLIAQHHAISFGTALGVWQQNPGTGVFEYNPNGDHTIDHAMVVVGYDSTQKIFRIRNSWGAWWNGDGYADITYDLFFQTVAGPTYVTALRNPNDRGQGGNGAWRGFWRGSVDGHKGVAVIHHAYQPNGNTDVVSNDAGYFYTDGGRTYPIEWLGGNASYASLKIDGDSYTLIMAGDKLSAASISNSGFWSFFDHDETDWSRCVGQSTVDNLNPSSYGATVGDPYLFPLVSGCRY